MSESGIEIKFIVPVGEVSERHHAEAERQAREAYILALLRQGDVSAGRAAELLDGSMAACRIDVRAWHLAF